MRGTKLRTRRAREVEVRNQKSPHKGETQKKRKLPSISSWAWFASKLSLAQLAELSDMEAEEEAGGCCDTHCSRCVYCFNICPKASVEEPHRPKCCGCKTKACVQLLSGFTVIVGLCIGASTILAYAEPCDVPLAPLMLTISSMFVWSGMLLFCLPEEWHRCGILTVTWCTVCWLVPANFCEEPPYLLPFSFSFASPLHTSLVFFIHFLFLSCQSFLVLYTFFLETRY